MVSTTKKNEKIGAFLKNARKKTGLTQVAVAELIGVSESTYNRMEKPNADVSYEVLAKLSVVLKFAVSDVFTVELPRIGIYGRIDESELVERFFETQLAYGVYDERLVRGFFDDIIGQEPHWTLFNLLDDFDCSMGEYHFLMDEDDTLEEFLEKIVRYRMKDLVEAEVHARLIQNGGTALSRADVGNDEDYDFAETTRLLKATLGCRCGKSKTEMIAVGIGCSDCQPK